MTEEQEVNELDDQVTEAPELEEDDGEDVITIGEDSSPQEEDKQEAPDWVKELRRNHREQQKELKKLRSENEALKGTRENPTTNQPLVKPTIEDCDYDNKVYAQKLEQYFEDKRKVDERQLSAQQEWGNTLKAYGDNRDKLNVRDFEDAEGIVQDTLNETQQGIILQVAENSAKVVYALGKNEEQAKKLAAITNPLKFAAEIAKIEAQIKITKRRPSTTPEKIVSGSEKLSGSAHEKHLEKLREKARETGDFSPVLAYQRKHNL